MTKIRSQKIVDGLISKINSYLNTKTFEVELDITQHFTTTVTVTGDFEGVNDPDLDQAAQQAADRMAHDDWNWEETEFDVRNAKLLESRLKVKQMDNELINSLDSEVRNRRKPVVAISIDSSVYIQPSQC
ncbi:hypothetical protein UP12_19200 (plasmid) [Bacillus pumilus]|uniref:hypothetical protein n=1 Tax=Bacillus pumilus TaxID=1408 RepID=UPI0007764FA7|nr:hypothetical protein [Bacillus pumilus]AMM99543.1 hypothetical protein UP12_19200 [Bacillus pumilus]